MPTQHVIDLINEFQYYDWEYYFSYKFKDNPYLCCMDMDHEHSYSNQDIIKIYNSLPENIDEFVINHKRQEDYFFLGLSYDFCHKIQLKHQIFPLLQNQDYDAIYDFIDSNQERYSIWDITLVLIDYFFHHHMREGEISSDDDNFFLDLEDLLDQQNLKMKKARTQLLKQHVVKLFRFRTIEQVKEIASKTKKHLSFTHQYAHDMNEIGFEMNNIHSCSWYKLISYEEMIKSIHQEKSHIEALITSNTETKIKKKTI